MNAIQEATISVPGHKPLSSTEPSPHEGRDVQELEAGAFLTNRPSLHYYTSPASRARTEVLELDVPVGRAPVDVAAASFGDSTLLELVIGNDDRVRVADELMQSNPWRQICALRIRSKTGRAYVGSGWFIAPSVVATAGHCVYLQNEGGWAQSIDVIPALRGDGPPLYGSATATRFKAVDGWVNGGSRDFDYGVIILDDDTLGRRVGNFAVQALSDSALKSVMAKISGYPADRDRAMYQYFHERPLMSSTATRLEYDIDTFGGQSGSVVFVDTVETGVVAIGIHTTGGSTSNSGTRINADVLRNLIAWIEGR